MDYLELIIYIRFDEKRKVSLTYYKNLLPQPEIHYNYNDNGTFCTV